MTGKFVNPDDIESGAWEGDDDDDDELERELERGAAVLHDDEAPA